MDQSPKAGVIEVIDVAVHLPPAQVVSNGLEIGVSHYSGIEGGRVLELLCWEEGSPVEDIASSKVGGHRGHDFAVIISYRVSVRMLGGKERFGANSLFCRQKLGRRAKLEWKGGEPELIRSDYMSGAF